MNFLQLWVSDRTRGTGFERKERRSRLNTKGKFLMERVVMCWSRMAKEVVDDLSLEILKASLDGDLGNLI